MALNEDEQTEAVFKSVRAEVDPVSGNEVPPGSLPEEVRDDIPAMLSEGEYVVPADVLRYYGVKFFEDLRAMAKMGLAEMDANGRIGGEPIEAEEDDLPFADEELMVEEDGIPSEEEMNAALGGLVGYADGGAQLDVFGNDMFQQDPDDPTQVIMGSQAGTGGYELITYYGPAGQEVNIPFFNGTPLGAIPAGYTQTKPEATAASQVLRDDDPSEGAAQRAKEAYKAEETATDYTDPLSVKKAVDGYYASAAMPALATLAVGPFGKIFGKMARKGAKEEILKGIDSALEDTSIDPPTKKKLEDQKTLLQDKDAYKKQKESKGFADSFLGDLLGFDGEFGLSEERKARSRSSTPDYSSKLTNLRGPQEGLEWMGSERDAYNAAVRTGNDAVVQHFEIVNKHREAQEAYKRGESTGNVMLSDATIERLDKEIAEEKEEDEV
ncbi:hypothetical protein CRP603_gp62 [Roseobacter phage CRP-603]|nr:hypothetical protein CRP603_gp62 [Roseobacter phage CRP-603]